MRAYPHEAWVELGRTIRRARKSSGFRDTTAWADKVGRSSRVLLGLERGEPAGEETLERIDEALGKPMGWCIRLLAAGGSEDAAHILELAARNPARTVAPESEDAAFVPDNGGTPAMAGLSDEQLLAHIRELQSELDRRVGELERRVRE